MSTAFNAVFERVATAMARFLGSYVLKYSTCTCMSSAAISFPGVIVLTAPFFPSMPCSIIITPGSVTPKYPNIRDITISPVVDPFCVGR